MSKLFTTILPSMLAGGLLLGGGIGRADDGRTMVGFWPAASDVGGVGTAKKAGSATAPTPPTPPTPPRVPAAGTPVPPVPPHAPAAPVPPAPQVNGIPPGLNIQIHDGKVQIDGLDKLIDDQINNALQAVQAPGVPPEVRKKVEERLTKIREKVKKKLAKIDANNLDELGDQLGELGDEIGEEMDQFGEDMDAWGDKFGKDMAKKMEKQFAGKGVHVHVDNDDDDDNDNDMSPPDVDDDRDLDDAVRDLGDLHLSLDERATISQLRADTDKQVAAAKHSLDAASDKLKKLLDNPKSNEVEVANAIDAVSQQEAAIRKARIVAWVKARNILSDDQRKKVEDAAKKHK
jgi:hypothetical protein